MSKRDYSLTWHPSPGLTYLEDLPLGSRFILPCSNKQGTLLEVNTGSAKVRWDTSKEYNIEKSAYVTGRSRTEHIAPKTEVKLNNDEGVKNA